MIYKLDYTLTITGLHSKNDFFELDLRLTDKGFTITESMNNFGDSISLFVPKKYPVRYLEDAIIFSDFESKTITKGNVINISYGYSNVPDQKNVKQFFVTEVIINKYDVEIRGLDISYFLTLVRFDFENITISLKELNQQICDKVNLLIRNYNDDFKKSSKRNNKLVNELIPSKTSIDLDVYFPSNKNVNAVEILKALKNNYALDSTCRSYKADTDDVITIEMGTDIMDTEIIGYIYPQLTNVLYIGINWNPNQPDELDTRRILFSDIPQALINTVEQDKAYNKIINRDNLRYQTKDFNKIKVVAKVYKRTGKPIAIEADNSDPDGAIRSYQFYDKSSTNTDISKWKALLNNEIQKLKYEGFAPSSSFITFGIVNLKPFDKAVFDGIGYIRADKSPQSQIASDQMLFLKKSTYMVESTITTFNSSGWRQEVGISYLVPNVNNDSIIDKIYPDYTFNLNNDEKRLDELEDQQRDYINTLKLINSRRNKK